LPESKERYWPLRCPQRGADWGGGKELCARGMPGSVVFCPLHSEIIAVGREEGGKRKEIARQGKRA